MAVALSPPIAAIAHRADAALGLADRLIPAHASQFDFQITAGLDAQTFEISGGGDAPVVIRGASNGSIASGLNWYLKYYCHAHVSWCGDQLTLPAVMPLLAEPARVRSPYKWRYYFNYCTFSYSLAFWDWARWEREIDWMALSGINLPLAVTGQEAVWQRVYRKMGFTDQELGEFFAGPAFLAWGWMGNLDGWGGPSPQSWIDGQATLQKKILRRMREYGMKPALPSFTGHVPPSFCKRFPNAKCKELEKWAETFTGTFILDINDPLFQEIGHRFMEEQRALYGSDIDGESHFFSCDTFNENSPPTDDPKWLDAAGRNIYDAMSGADEKAIWVLQDWMFYFNPTAPNFWQKPQINALLDSVPNDRMLVLDLHSDAFPLGEKTHYFNGKPWVWCFLHNFGGHQSMYGNLKRLASDPPAALKNPASGNLVGFGLTPEGIEQNPVMYDLATDMMWRGEAPHLTKWLAGYVQRRYGKSNEAATKAWAVLAATAYDRPPEWGGTVSTSVNLPPRLNSDRMRSNYPPADLIPAWENLQAAAADPIVGATDGFKYDLINTARQVLANAASAMITRASVAHASGDFDAFQVAGQAFVELINDMDALLATRPEFLLGRWLEAAKAWGKTDSEKKLLEENARRQITLWGGSDSMLRDYARKEWAGLLKNFYAVRWSRYFDFVAAAMKKGDQPNEKEFQKDLRAWEDAWAKQRETYPTQPVGDSAAISARMLAKYSQVLANLYPKNVSLLTGKPAAGSASTSTGHRAALAVTGIVDRSVYWTANQTPAWLSIDLGTATLVDTVHFFPFWGDGRIYHYTIEGSIDGRSWNVLIDAAANTTPTSSEGHLHAFAPAAVRHLRVNILKNSVNEAAHILDVRAYGPSLAM